MSAESKDSDPARPFAPAIWAKAEDIAKKYQVLTWYDDEEEAYFGRCVEMPNCMSHGRTPAERDAMVMEATTLFIACLLEEGQRVPLPSRQQSRTEQVNIRLSRIEKQAVEDAAYAAGFRRIGDYIRVKLLA